MKTMMLLIGMALIAISSLAQVEEKTKKQQVSEALSKKDGLKEATRLSGGRFVTNDANTHGWLVFENIHDLAKSSDLVVIGFPKDNVCKLTPFGNGITTDYQFQIEEVVKGKEIVPGSLITVSLPGGRVSFEDGSMAQVNAPNFRTMQNGNRYVLYLKKLDNGYYYPNGGPQGVFELQSSGRIRAHALPKIDKVATWNEKDASEFLIEVKKEQNTKEDEKK